MNRLKQSKALRRTLLSSKYNWQPGKTGIWYRGGIGRRSEVQRICKHRQFKTGKAIMQVRILPIPQTLNPVYENE